MGIRRMRGLVALASVALLSACGRVVPPPAPTVPPPGTNAVAMPLRSGPDIADLNLRQADAAGALASFRESCPRLLQRPDASGLTRNEDWRPACTAAASTDPDRAAAFFRHWFETARVGDGMAYATGYYEPEIAGSHKRLPGFDVPVYRLPPDLVRAKPGDAPPDETGKQPLGRYESGRFVPYHDRAAIEGGALMGRGLELAWAADPVEFFFLQVQGSGRLKEPDGTVIRLGYAGQNGYRYTSIGRLMRERGLLGNGPGQVSGSMQGIMQWLRDHPEQGRALMRENQSYVFFRELTGDGPVGALGVPVRAGSSAAADPLFVTLGAPVWLEVDRAEANGLWIAQDTGGAIKGANRFDTFWGAGPDARQTAGTMAARGKALVLLPKGTLKRLGRP